MAIRSRMHHEGSSDPKEELDPGEVEGTTLRLLKYPHPQLRAENLPVVHFDDDLRRTAEGMLLIMYAADGIGLAAPQVGVNLRLMVFNETGDPNDTEEEMVLCNPHITSSSEETAVKEEACLSFPNVYGTVRRALRIEVKFQDMDGEHHSMQLQGLAARVFLHEYDHLDRVLFTPFVYPVDYGYFDNTLGGDGDPLDALVLLEFPVFPGVVVDVRPVGVLPMEDDGGIDEKVICVQTKDPRYAHIKDINDVPEQTKNEIKHFFEHYKDLEPGKWVKVGEWKDAAEAERLIKEALQRYVPPAGH